MARISTKIGDVFSVKVDENNKTLVSTKKSQQFFEIFEN